MWCLCRFNAISLCSWDTKRTNASPLRRPCGDKQSATPPLEIRFCLFLLGEREREKEMGETKLVNILFITLIQLKILFGAYSANWLDRLCFLNMNRHNANAYRLGLQSTDARYKIEFQNGTPLTWQRLVLERIWQYLDRYFAMEDHGPVLCKAHQFHHRLNCKWEHKNIVTITRPIEIFFKFLFTTSAFSSVLPSQRNVRTAKLFTLPQHFLLRKAKKRKNNWNIPLTFYTQSSHQRLLICLLSIRILFFLKAVEGYFIIPKKINTFKSINDIRQWVKVYIG